MNYRQLFIPAAFLFLLASCGRSEQGAQELLPVKVRTEKIMPSGANATSFYSGTVEEENTSALSFSVMGTVKTVNASTGMPVRKGQLLATVDETAIRSSYNAAKASLAQAEDAYERMKKVYDKGSLPEIKWIEIQSKLQQARSMEEMARKNLSDCKLYAPFSGVISGKEIEIGQNVTPGVPVIHIVSGKNANVKISVPENEIYKVHKGQKALIIVPALDNLTLSGEVAEKGVQANPLSRSYEVKLRIRSLADATEQPSPTPASSQPEDTSASSRPSAGYGLNDVMPGMITEVALTGPDDRQQVMVPADILQLDECNQYFVWLKKDNKAVKQTVQCGEFTAKGVVILSGIHIGDEIITQGQQKVCEGTPVC